MKTPETKKLINWAEVSRLLSGDRTTIRANRIPKIHLHKIDELLDFVEKWQESYLK